MNLLTPPEERELPLPWAYARIQQELSRLGLVSKVQTLGQRIVNTRVMLTCSVTRRHAGGSGKGYKDSALTGACFEALEHYLTDFHALDAPLELQPTGYFTRSGYLQDDSLLDVVVQDSQAHIACRRYHSPLDNQSFSYPIALSLPAYAQAPIPGDTFDYASLKRYCCNSGIAIGATWNEAVLHATNECLERDALSLFLLRHFYYQHDQPLLTLKRPLQGEPLAQLWQDAEAELGTTVVVVDISSEFCARTYLAFTSPGTRPVGLFGSGTSLSAEHAVRRALTELVQLKLSARLPEVAQHIELQKRHLARFPRLQRCLLLDTDQLLARVRQQTVSLPPPGPEQRLTDQIQLLARNIRYHQRELGVSVMYQSGSGTTLANVVVPGLERFYIVSSGNVVIPQARGQALDARNGGEHA